MKYLKLKENYNDRVNGGDMYISFGQAIAKPNRVVILEGINVERIAAKDKKNKFRIDKIREKIPMNFTKINTVLHRELSSIEYIEFWKGIRIKEVID